MDAQLLIAYSVMFASALFCIYSGSWASVRMPRSARRALRKANGETDDDDDEDDIERITIEDAMLLPIVGAVALVTLFLAIKYLPPHVLDRILGAYFGVIGTAALAHIGVLWAKVASGRAQWRTFKRWEIILNYGERSLVDLRFTNVHIAAATLGAATLGAYSWTKSWPLSNLVAASLAFNGVSLVRLDSFLTGTIMLAGLFCYDVVRSNFLLYLRTQYFVFYSVVMVSVAKGIDGPIKVVWPRDLTDHKAGMAMLGLGDIIVPGLFVALALRFDYAQAIKRNAKPPLPNSWFHRPYFRTCFISYIVGLLTTFVVMHTFKAAQPALLYLSPACSLSVIGLAVIRGEWKEFWGYSDGDENDKPTRHRSNSTPPISPKHNLLPFAPTEMTSPTKPVEETRPVSAAPSEYASDEMSPPPSVAPRPNGVTRRRSTRIGKMSEL